MAEKLLTFVHISDTHIHPARDYTGSLVDFSSRLPTAALINAINILPAEVDFVLHTGDVVEDRHYAQTYEMAARVLSKLNYPYYTIPGNHDDAKKLQHDLLKRETIKPTLDETFEVNGVQIMLLDSSSPGDASGYLMQEQLVWIEAELSKPDERPLVVALHHHPLPTDAPWMDNIKLINGDKLHALLLKVKDRLRGVFYGHIHLQSVTMRDGIPYYSVSSGWFQTQLWHGQTTPRHDRLHNPGFNLVTLTETDTFVRFVRVPL